MKLNTYSIIPIGPDFESTLKKPHDRDRAFGNTDT